MQGCGDIDDIVKAAGRQEPYIVAAETDDHVEYHIYIESECLLSVHFILGLKDTQKVPVSVSAFCSSLF